MQGPLGEIWCVNSSLTQWDWVNTCPLALKCIFFHFFSCAREIRQAQSERRELPDDSLLDMKHRSQSSFSFPHAITCNEHIYSTQSRLVIIHNNLRFLKNFQSVSRSLSYGVYCIGWEIKTLYWVLFSKILKEFSLYNKMTKY